MMDLQSPSRPAIRQAGTLWTSWTRQIRRRQYLTQPLSSAEFSTTNSGCHNFQYIKGLNVRFLSTTGKIGQTSQLSKQSWFLTLCVKVEVKPRRNIVSNRQPSAKEFRGRAGIARARSGQIILWARQQRAKNPALRLQEAKYFRNC